MAVCLGVPAHAQIDIAAVQAQAKQGDPGALTALGTAYASGQGVPQDFGKALQSYQQAAAAGDSLAEYNIGLMYESAHGVSQDLATAFRYYLQAAKQGVAQAQFNVGNMYAEGRGVGKDLFEAVLWFRQAAEKGLPEAQYNLGLAYELGRGVAKDLDQAKTWYGAAASQGFAAGKFRLVALGGATGRAAAAASAAVASPAAVGQGAAPGGGELDQLRAENARALDALQALQREKAVLEQRLAVAQAAMKDAVAAPAAAELQNRLSQLQQDNAGLNAEAKRSIIELSRLDWQLRRAQDALAKQGGSPAPGQKASGSADAEAKIADLTKALADARASAQALASDKTALQAQITELSAKAAAAPPPQDDSALKQLRLNAAQKDKDLDAARQETAELQVKFDSAQEDFKARIAALLAKPAAPAPAPEDNAFVKQLRLDAVQKDKDLAAARQETAELQIQFDSAREDFKARTQQLNAQMDELKHASAAQPAADSGALAKLSAQLDAAGKLIADLTARNNGLQHDLEAMKQSASQVPEGSSAAGLSAAALQLANQTLQEQVRLLEAQRDEDHRNFDQKFAAFSAELKASTAANRALSAANQALLDEKGAEDAALKSENASLSSQVQEFTASKDKSIKDNVTLASMVTQMQQATDQAKLDLANLQNRVAAGDKAAQEQSARLNALVSENQALKAQAQDLDQLRQQNAAVTARLSLAQNALDQIAVAARALSAPAAQQPAR